MASRCAKLVQWFNNEMKQIPKEVVRLICNYDTNLFACVQIRSVTHTVCVQRTYYLNESKTEWTLLTTATFNSSLGHTVVSEPDGHCVFVFNESRKRSTLTLDIVRNGSKSNFVREQVSLSDDRIHHLSGYLLSGNDLFAFGGTQPFFTEKTVTVTNLDSKIITSLPDMLSSEHEPSAILIGNILYVLGAAGNLSSFCLDQPNEKKKEKDEEKEKDNAAHLETSTKQNKHEWVVLRDCGPLSAERHGFFEFAEGFLLLGGDLNLCSQLSNDVFCRKESLVVEWIPLHLWIFFSREHRLIISTIWFLVLAPNHVLDNDELVL